MSDRRASQNARVVPITLTIQECVDQVMLVDGSFKGFRALPDNAGIDWRAKRLESAHNGLIAQVNAHRHPHRNTQPQVAADKNLEAARGNLTSVANLTAMGKPILAATPMGMACAALLNAALAAKAMEAA